MGGAGVSADELAGGAGCCCTLAVAAAGEDVGVSCCGISGSASNKAFLALVTDTSIGGK